MQLYRSSTASCYPLSFAIDVDRYAKSFLALLKKEKRLLSHFKVLLDVDFKSGWHVHAASFLGWWFWYRSVMCFLTRGWVWMGCWRFKDRSLSPQQDVGLLSCFRPPVYCLYADVLTLLLYCRLCFHTFMAYLFYFRDEIKVSCRTIWCGIFPL